MLIQSTPREADGRCLGRGEMTERRGRAVEGRGSQMDRRPGYNVVIRARVQGPRVGAEGWPRQTKKRPGKFLYSFMSQENSDSS